jgi:predicted MPP superfamily phosphohydrolase
VHLSDFHARRGWWRAYDELIELVNQSADLVLFTGDLVDDKRDYRPALPTIQRLLRGFQIRLGTYIILGNHDGSLLSAHLPPLGIHYIDGKYVRLPVGSDEIELIGLPGVHRQDLDPQSLIHLPARRPDTPRLVLSHYPDQVLLTRLLQPDLYLTGHTHGGQICLPGGLPLLRHDSLPARLCTGIHRFADTWMVVNRGFGFSGPRVRLFCPAEVIQIVLEDTADKPTNDGQNGPLQAGPPGDNPPVSS